MIMFNIMAGIYLDGCPYVGTVRFENRFERL